MFQEVQREHWDRYFPQKSTIRWLQEASDYNTAIQEYQQNEREIDVKSRCIDDWAMTCGGPTLVILCFIAMLVTTALACARADNQLHQAESYQIALPLIIAALLPSGLMILYIGWAMGGACWLVSKSTVPSVLADSDSKTHKLILPLEEAEKLFTSYRGQQLFSNLGAFIQVDSCGNCSWCTNFQVTHNTQQKPFRIDRIDQNKSNYALCMCPQIELNCADRKGDILPATFCATCSGFLGEGGSMLCCWAIIFIPLLVTLALLVLSSVSNVVAWAPFAGSLGLVGLALCIYGLISCCNRDGGTGAVAFAMSFLPFGISAFIFCVALVHDGEIKPR